jgi:hypothetical protein
MAYSKKKENEEELPLPNTEGLDIVTQRRNKANNFYQLFLSNCDRYYKLYRNVISKPDNAFRSKVSIPVAFWTIETTVPRMVAQPHKYAMTPRDPENAAYVEFSIQAKQYFDYVLDEAGLRKKTRILAKDMKIFGSGFWKYGWDYEKECIWIYNKPMRQILADPSVSCPGAIQDAKYVIDICPTTKDELLTNPNYDLRGIDLDTLGTDAPTQEEVSRTTRLAATNKYTDIKDPVEKDIMLWEHYGWVDGERRLIVVLDKKYVIRNQKWDHDFWPFGLAINTEDPDNLLGIGDIEPVADLMDDLNTNRRMRTDNKNIRTNVMFEVQRNAGIDEDELVWQPGGRIMSNIKDGITPIAIPDTTGGSVEEELLAIQQIEKATGTPAQLQGQLAATSPSSGGLLNRTATAYRGSEQATSVRFKYQSESLDMAVQETLRNLWKIIQENVTGDQVARVIGEDGERSWIKIPEEAIKKSYIIDLEYGSAALEDEQTKWDRAIAKLQTFATIFPESADLFAHEALIAVGDKNVNAIAAQVAERRQKAAEEGNLPKPPQINLSIGGEDMNSILIGELLKNYFPNLSPVALTPELFTQTRTLMQGQTPEDLERDKVKIMLFEAVTKAQQGEAKLSTDQMKIIADVLSNEQKNAEQRSEAESTETGSGAAATRSAAGA